MNDLSLVERLRYSGLGASWGALCKEAANLIESQAAKIEWLKAEHEALKDALVVVANQAIAERERITAERDALRAALFGLVDAHARNVLFNGGGHWDAARAALNTAAQQEPT